MTGDGWVVGKLVAAGPGYDARSKIILDLYLSECAALAGPRPRRGGELPAGRVIPTNTAARAPACSTGSSFANPEKMINTDNLGFYFNV